MQVVDKSVPEHERWLKIQAYLLNEVEGSEQHFRWIKLINIARANSVPPSDEIWRQFLRCFFGPMEDNDEIKCFRSSRHWSGLKGYMVRKKVQVLASTLPHNCAASSD